MKTDYAKLMNHDDIEEATPKIDFMYGVAYDAFKAKDGAQ